MSTLEHQRREPFDGTPSVAVRQIILPALFGMFSPVFYEPLAAAAAALTAADEALPAQIRVLGADFPKVLSGGQGGRRHHASFYHSPRAVSMAVAPGTTGKHGAAQDRVGARGKTFCLSCVEACIRTPGTRRVRPRT